MPFGSQIVFDKYLVLRSVSGSQFVTSAFLLSQKPRISFDIYQVWKNDSGSQTETSAQMLIMAGAHVASKAFAGISFIIARFVFEAFSHLFSPTFTFHHNRANLSTIHCSDKSAGPKQIQYN